MNQVKQRTESEMVNEFPLFASSWVALFHLLRENFTKGGAACCATANDSPSTGFTGNPH
jgi:hypothetical protein